VADPHSKRKPLLCPKCGSSRLVIQEIHEMWEFAQPKNAMPNFGCSFKKRVLCAEIGCGVEVWPERWVAPDVWPDDPPPKGKEA